MIGMLSSDPGCVVNVSYENISGWFCPGCWMILHSESLEDMRELYQQPLGPTKIRKMEHRGGWKKAKKNWVHNVLFTWVWFKDGWPPSPDTFSFGFLSVFCGIAIANTKVSVFLFHENTMMIIDRIFILVSEPIDARSSSRLWPCMIL